ncbi:MAG TPA: thioredoxin domain-containing protein [Candidatus Bathyarchaeia archaeon]|nr:thioredoxin domain-containing protein [Candidatus Bathyarchaeia archaeon]
MNGSNGSASSRAAAGAGRVNRLAGEKSPYLRQHAQDPVDWYPWGEEAFERARREDKPIFLSIGYSACHWCHVMARESFADEEAARLLNDGFVAVKVDREERPDLDQHYMTVCQSLTGSGGWPLTIMMTPDRRPFFAGTYYPLSRRFGHPGLLDLLPLIGEAWRTKRPEVLRSALEVAAAAERGPARLKGRRGEALSPATLDEAFRELAADFDRTRGGFGRAPKFPIAHHIGFLLRYWQRTGKGEALGMAGKTLKAMRAGGICDQLGFGFHRYATDQEWRVPHFEKMLYDQALLTEVYAQAFAATGRNEFRRTAAETADYVLRELAAPEGGFTTSEDADSEGEEGKFYTWTRRELEEVLGPEDAEAAAWHFGVGGTVGFGGSRYVLHEARPSDWPPRHAVPAPAPLSEAQAASIRRRLFQAREKRPRPFKDTKILADWNGLAIAALAAVFRVTGEDRYLRAAAAAADFVLDGMRDAGGRLWHVYSDGEARVPGFLADHAFMAKGLVALYEAGYDPRHLAAALELVDRAVDLFWDAGEGGFFFSAGDEAGARTKDVYDGALPSGNSVMFMDLLRLARLTGRTDLEEKASRLSSAFGAEVAGQPRMYTEFLCGLDYAIGPTREVVIVGRSDVPETRAMLAALRGTCAWDTGSLFKPVDRPEQAEAVERLAPFTKDMDAGGGAAAAHVCSGGACLRPILTAAGLAEALRPPLAAPTEPPRTLP